MVDSKDCLFCRIVKGEIPTKKVYEDSVAVAFLDINPRNPGHTLIVPKRHAEMIFDFPDSDGGRFFSALKKIAALVKNGTNAHGVSILQNNGSAAGQVVAHMHFHVIPRFLNEGPVALEAMLPVKKMDEKRLDAIAAAIKGSSVREGTAHALNHLKKERKSEPDEEEDTDEFEEINF